MELVIFIGIQCSGKSAFYKERFIDTHIRINLDMLKTRNREKIIFLSCLEAKQPVVIDNTNPTATDRRGYIPAAKQAHFKIVGYHFTNILTSCLNRNELRRESKIPVEAIVATSNRLEPPEFSEGFDAIYEVEIDDSGEFRVTEIPRSRTDW
jgi:predicted kinase